MNQNILIPSITFVIGASAGFLLGKYLLEEKYAMLAQEEIDSVKERFGLRGNVLSEVRDEDDTVETVSYKDIMPIPRGIIGGATIMGAHTNEINKSKQRYDKIIKEQNYTAFDFEKEPEPEDRYVKRPYMITEDDFSENEEFLSHDKITLTYYVEDDMLIDDNEEIIDDADMIAGYENLDMPLDEKEYVDSGGDNPIYVRNERLGSDYEICINFGSYQELILGVPPHESMDGLSPREQQQRRMKQRRREEDDE